MAGEIERIALDRGDDAFVLDEEGLQLVTSGSLFRSAVFASPKIPYDAITHFAASRFGFWLGTKTDVFSLRRSRFLEEDGPERLNEALIRAISRRPRGFDQLARISEIHTLARFPARQRAARYLVLACMGVYALQWSDPFVSEVAVMAPSLVDSGQVYRLISANFLHGLSLIPLHLIFNSIGLLGLSLLVERPLGPVRTGVVMAVSGLVAMLSSYAFTQGTVLGASGIVMGLAGAALCLELHRSHRLPVWWRVPRRPFIALLLVESAIGFAVPFVAGEAHFGGLVAGYITTRLLLRGDAFEHETPRALRRLALAMAVVTGVALSNAAFLVLRESSALVRYGRQLLATDNISVDHDNGTAWIMVTESRADVTELETAQLLAERAANGTDYRNPEILDTLAEVLFVRGDEEGALRMIDEAIRITGGESYYVEQRRRFTGEREFDDRPPPPSVPWRQLAPFREDEQAEPGLVI